VWARGVVVPPPGFDQDFGLPEIIEDLPRQQLVPELGVEAFAVSVFPWASRFDIERLHADADRPPDQGDRDGVFFRMNVEFGAQRAGGGAAGLDAERAVRVFDLEQGFALSEADEAFGFRIDDCQPRVGVERDDGSVFKRDRLLFADGGGIGERGGFPCRRTEGQRRGRKDKDGSRSCQGRQGEPPAPARPCFA